MYEDPLQELDKIVRQMHDNAGKYTQPVLKKYPLLFAFFVTFSVAAILHGFELFVDQIPFFHEYPATLIAIGVLSLFLTGTLYKLLEKDRK